MECFPISRKADSYQEVSGRLGIRGERARLGGFGDYNRGSVIGDRVRDRHCPKRSAWRCLALRFVWNPIINKRVEAIHISRYQGHRHSYFR
jgi:hypothetical protein